MKRQGQSLLLYIKLFYGSGGTVGKLGLVARSQQSLRSERQFSVAPISADRIAVVKNAASSRSESNRRPRYILFN